MPNDLSAGRVDIPARVDNSIVYFNDTNCSYFVESGGGKTTLSIFPLLLSYLCQIWCRLFSPTPGDLIDTWLGKVDQGQGTVPQPLGYVSVDLEDISYKGGMSYGGREYANYGWISFLGPDGFAFPVQWINFKKSIIVAPQAGCDGIQWYLAPGIEADIRLYGQFGACDIRGGHNVSPEWKFNPYKNIFYGP